MVCSLYLGTVLPPPLTFKDQLHSVAFLVSAGSLMLASPWQPVIGDRLQRLCVTPIAVDCSSTAKFCVQGFNIVQPTTKYVYFVTSNSLH